MITLEAEAAPHLAKLSNGHRCIKRARFVTRLHGLAQLAVPLLLVDALVECTGKHRGAHFLVGVVARVPAEQGGGG